MMPTQYRRRRKKRPSAFILIGDGFDELEVIYFLHKFRQAGISIKSVSLFNNLVFSRQGVGLKADYSLADKPFVESADDCFLILPTGGRNGDALRRDARVKSLLRSFDQGSGRVILTDSNSELAQDVRRLLSQRPSWPRHGSERLDEFVDSLTQKMVYV